MQTTAGVLDEEVRARGRQREPWRGSSSLARLSTLGWASAARRPASASPRKPRIERGRGHDARPAPLAPGARGRPGWRPCRPPC